GEKGRGLQVIAPTGEVIQKLSQLDLIGDCAISPDGDLLFLTGIMKQEIYCFARQGSTYDRPRVASSPTPMPSVTARVTSGLITPIPTLTRAMTPSATPLPPASALTPAQLTPVPPEKPVWRDNLSETLAEIIRPGSPYLYVAGVFCVPDDTATKKFFAEILPDEFILKYDKIIWTKVDIRSQPGYLGSYNILNVPTIIVFNSRGEQLLRLVKPVSQQYVATVLGTLSFE
ncbi:MAG: thioredoxin family protein, partial [Candidatus Sumerlaeia bacterium]|nr:thioredoxin family protein [Candidatus Sumerlaeia bacterium]